MSLEWQNGKVVNIIDETPSTRRYFIEATDLETFDFKPGQFVTLDLPIHEKKNKRWRSYSIASAPNGTNIFELVWGCALSDLCCPVPHSSDAPYRRGRIPHA